MRKKIGILLIINLVFFSSIVFAAELPEFGQAEGVMIAELKSDDILFQQNQTEKFDPASTTKVMTALVALEHGNLGEVLTVGAELQGLDSAGSTAGLIVDETITLNELLYGVLLASGNDASMTIAVNIGKKIAGNALLTPEEATKAFVKAMNDKAKALGMENTSFENPHGLSDPNQYSTPEDLLKLGKEAFSNDVIKEIGKTKTHTVEINMALKGNEKAKNSKENPATEHSWTNTNILLFPTYEELGKEYTDKTGLTGKNTFYNTYATAGRTGLTEDGNACLLFSGEGGEKTIIAVIMNGDEFGIFTEAGATLNTIVTDYDFINWTKENNFISEIVIENYHIFDGETLVLKTKDPLVSLVNRTEKERYKTRLQWDNSIVKEEGELFSLLSHVKEDDVIGELQVLNGDQLMEVAPILAMNSMKAQLWWDYLIIYWYVTLLFAILFLIFLRIFYVHLRRKNRAKYKRRTGARHPQRRRTSNHTVQSRRRKVTSRKRRPSTGTRRQTGTRKTQRAQNKRPSEAGKRR